ncbi:colicin immunity domain-containing protein [Streptomyces sp. MRC013]|uniref:colicin immunity domain-containing protein n=1 Tax=Streptomyces sp. MRC013 TaxID=2898276 RepID=UPI0020275065|nr:colicin immunity domain-containing protein [Streptomyces sp. MRC013]URM90809.1 colicin immunity domain-containing protein [Streptomyces sp. MRC013]
MEALCEGSATPESFARGWLAARRRALGRRERLKEPLGRLLDRVFYALEDYSIDPALREEGDVSDDELIAIVRDTLQEMKKPN